jgi:hypothetical protein
MNRTEILNAASTAVTSDRNAEYGPPENSFSGIADYWNLYLEQCGTWPITPEMVGMMLLLMKVSRQNISPGKADHYVDMAGYAACVGGIASVQMEFDFESKFPDPPLGRKWHNPENLTPEEVGIADGWRLCLEDEPGNLPDQYLNDDYEWTGGECIIDTPYGNFESTYRTKAPLPQ